MTVAMDGTNQTDNGIPQFREKSKADGKFARLKNHLEIVQIAASPDIVHCYVVPEDIATTPTSRLRCYSES
jgi:hypothetical protein